VIGKSRHSGTPLATLERRCGLCQQGVELTKAALAGEIGWGHARVSLIRPQASDICETYFGPVHNSMP
jgi:hypothetical protein